MPTAGATGAGSRHRLALPLLLFMALLMCALLLRGCAVASVRAVPAEHAPQLAPLAPDAYTGFVIGPKASLDAAGRFWLAGFTFRPTRERRLPVDAAVAALDVRCSYAGDQYEALFEELGGLITFTAVAGPDGHLTLTSCPVDARPEGDVDTAALR